MNYKTVHILCVAVMGSFILAGCQSWQSAAGTPPSSQASHKAPVQLGSRSPASGGKTAPSANHSSTASRATFYVYADKGARVNHFAPSGWMGDYGDVRIDDGSTVNPEEGRTVIKISYSGRGSEGAGWAGMYWQQPANNWGNKPGGFDLSKMKRLTFWARGTRGGETIAEFKMGGIAGENGDSDSAGIGPVVLTKTWKKYTISLASKNLSHVVGGFCWSANHDDNPHGFTMYLDEIRYER